MFSQIVLLLTALVYFCNAQPLLSPSHVLTARDALRDCQNLTLGLNASCWDILPQNVGMQSWLNTWNKTTTTCNPGEMWANCFMREANVTTNVTRPIRCDLIGSGVCPEPNIDELADVPPEVAYGAVAIWALQQYMTTVYQYITGDDGASDVKNGFLNQTVPRSAKPILTNILSELGDPIAGNLSTLVTTPERIGQPTFIIPTEDLAPQVVGQTVGYLLQWVMEDWTDVGFSALAVQGNLIAIVGDSDDSDDSDEGN